MDNLNKPFASIQLSEEIKQIISNDEYISISYGDNCRLLSFKIN